MAYKTCPDCGSRVFEHGCVNCDEDDYISMQDDDDFVPCSKCDGHDACHDFGCAIELGLGKMLTKSQPTDL